MSKKRRRNVQTRDAPTPREKSGGVFLCSPEAWDVLCGDGYKPLTECAEVQTCAGIYGDLIASMTIHLMQNGEKGDVRIKNELSRKIDISPNKYLTRQNFISLIVKTFILHGNQVTLPIYKGRYLDDLLPVPPSRVSFLPEVSGEGYKIQIGGETFDPDEVLHFAYNVDPENPYMGKGFSVALRDVVKSIRQANATKQELMKSPKPSIIVKVDGLTEEFQSREGRRKLQETYFDDVKNGAPWMIPSEAFSVEQIKPLTVADLAIKDTLEMDKRAAASIMHVPPFLLGVGEYKHDAWRWFVQTAVMQMANILQQEMTKKLLWDDRLYWRFNPRSLMNYDMQELVTVGKEMVDRIAMTRNELRDWMGMAPREDMEELLALENFIPAAKLKDQKKLKGGDGDDE